MRRSWSLKPSHRDEVFLVSKVLPEKATHRGTLAACDQSLRRVRTDRLDLHPLHWRGDVPLAETLAGLHDFAELNRAFPPPRRKRPLEML